MRLGIFLRDNSIIRRQGVLPNLVCSTGDKTAAEFPSSFEGRRIEKLRRKETRGAACDAVFYVQKSKVKLNLISKNGKEVTVAILNPGDFFGEGGLAGQPLRIDSATALTDCELMRIENSAMRLALHQERAFSDMFVAYLVQRNIQYEANLVAQIFNSSEE